MLWNINIAKVPKASPGIVTDKKDEKCPKQRYWSTFLFKSVKCLFGDFVNETSISGTLLFLVKIYEKDIVPGPIQPYSVACVHPAVTSKWIRRLYVWWRVWVKVRSKYLLCRNGEGRQPMGRGFWILDEGKLLFRSSVPSSNHWSTLYVLIRSK